MNRYVSQLEPLQPFLKKLHKKFELPKCGSGTRAEEKAQICGCRAVMAHLPAAK